MIPKIEFSVGDQVHYYNGNDLIKTVVTKVLHNPINNEIEYRCSRYIHRKNNSRTVERKLLKPHQIKESKEFVGNESKKLKKSEFKRASTDTEYFVGKDRDGRGSRNSVKQTTKT